MVERKIIKLNIEDLVPYENNPRNNKNAIQPVADSIKEVGYNTAIIVDENKVILAGHTRWEALKSLGESKIEVIQVTGMTEEQKKKFRLYDNKTSELAVWDYVALLDEISSIPDFEPLNIDWGITGKDDYDTEYVNKEYDAENFDDEQFEYECPHCGFRFNE